MTKKKKVKKLVKKPAVRKHCPGCQCACRPVLPATPPTQVPPVVLPPVVQVSAPAPVPPAPPAPPAPPSGPAYAEWLVVTRSTDAIEPKDLQAGELALVPTGAGALEPKRDGDKLLLNVVSRSNEASMSPEAKRFAVDQAPALGFSRASIEPLRGPLALTKDGRLVTDTATQKIWMYAYTYRIRHSM